MRTSNRILLSLALVLVLALIVSCNPNPQPEPLTPVPTLAPAAEVTLIPALGEVPEVAPSPVPDAGQAGEPAPVVPVGDPDNGAALFALNCSVCHGENAEGGPVGPTLVSAEMAAKDDNHYRLTLKNGIEGTAMASFDGRLSDQEIEDLIAFIRSLQ
jgi:mono/diheme cytochrome c family protein